MKLYWKETLALFDLSTLARALLFTAWVIWYKVFEYSTAPRLYWLYFWFMLAWFVAFMVFYDYVEKKVKSYVKRRVLQRETERVRKSVNALVQDA